LFFFYFSISAKKLSTKLELTCAAIRRGILVLQTVTVDAWTYIEHLHRLVMN